MYTLEVVRRSYTDYDLYNGQRRVVFYFNISVYKDGKMLGFDVVHAPELTQEQIDKSIAWVIAEAFRPADPTPLY
jgi:hypothetical protein